MSVKTTALADQYLEYLEKVEQLSPKTVLNRRYIMVPFFRYWDRPIEDITLQDIDQYFMQRTIKQSSMGAERQTLRSFFKYLQEYRETSMTFRWEVVRRKKTKPGNIKIFTQEDVTEVVGLCGEVQDKLIICLLFETGMRIGELLRLRFEDIMGEQIHVRGKGEVDRVVFMSKQLADAIYHYTTQKGCRTGFVFRPLQKHKNHSNDRYVSAYGVRDRIARAFLKCGHKMHPHLLRHSFAVNWVMKGGDIRTLQILLGHSSIETTQWYLRFSDQQTFSVYQRVLPEGVFN